MEIRGNVEQIQAKIARAAERSGRSADAVTLIAVSKLKSLQMIEAVAAVGVRDFGENRSDELLEKANAHPELNWHFIGHLQTRQSQPVADHAACFHAVDRVKIAARLNRQLERPLPVFIEVNVSGEENKYGLDCSNWEADGGQRDALIQAITTILELPRIEVQGLMTMAPYVGEEKVVRSVFGRTRRLSEYLQSAVPAVKWDKLSMGMTNDYAIGIEEGATHVRVGRAIFGERNY